MTTIRSSGTILSATVSLGYDVPRGKVETLLLEAARRAELGEPFVQVLDLGDFSVTYRVAGLWTEVKHLVSARSRLRACVMDRLHEGGVEIVSPSFMNTRALSEDMTFVPAPSRSPALTDRRPAPEDLVFDKADEAESLEALRTAYAALEEEIKALQATIDKTAEGPDREQSQSQLSKLQARQSRLEQVIAARHAKVEGRD